MASASPLAPVLPFCGVPCMAACGWLRRCWRVVQSRLRAARWPGTHAALR
ncbi:hypothetical protein ACFOPN_05675 [Xanthomonas hyacinthi]